MDGGYLVPSVVMPYDLSLQGIRGRWERPLPEGVDFPLYLDLGRARPVKLTARVAWQQALPPSATMAGLHFVKPSKQAQGALRSYLKGLQQATRRETERIEDIIPVEIILREDEESFTTIASDLSRDGLQVTNDFPLPQESTFRVLLPLSWDAPLELTARVRWQKQTAFGGSVAGLQFVDADAEQIRLIEMYMLALTEVRHTLEKGEAMAQEPA
jgi:hypothetical protein